MTGFASLTHEDERASIGVTVKAVNHRFLDLQIRIPPAFGDLEPRVHLGRDLAELTALAQGVEVEYALTLPGEGGETEVFFSDLSEEYVTFNATYTS